MIGAVVIGNIVHLDGVPVLDAKGERLRHRSTCSTMCQWCKHNTRFEPALGRRMYWHGISLPWEELKALRCGDCRKLVTE